MKEFTQEVCEKIKYYVYRLIDPRNGQTFYVGKGKGNRVFAHVNYALNGVSMLKDDDDDDVSLKVKTIRDIYSDGFEVIHVIHRWGIESSEQAFVVEAAVMDCFAGLSNIQNGYDVEHSAIRAELLGKRFEIAQFEEPKDLKFMIIKIKQEIIDERGSIYEAVRKAWRVNVNEAKSHPYVLAVKNGIVEEVYEPLVWQRNKERPERYEFEGNVAQENVQLIFKGKRIPDKYCAKGMSNPVLYSKS